MAGLAPAPPESEVRRGQSAGRQADLDAQREPEENVIVVATEPRLTR